MYDDDTGKNGVFSLTLLGNNGTFEISPNVAERRANFLIYVRDNHLLDYEMRHSVQFQVSYSLFHCNSNLMILNRIDLCVDSCSGIRAGHQSFESSERCHIH